MSNSLKYNITPKEVYEKIKNDDEILKIYTEIEKMELSTGGQAFHNYEHVKNVSTLTNKILTDLNQDEDVIYNAKIACLLHDVGALYGKEGHAERSYEYAKLKFDKNNWNFAGRDDVLDGIKNHSEGFDRDGVITLALILSDKLDVKKNRITPAGMMVEGNRQFMHVEDIDIKITDKMLKIKFITDGKIDIDELSSYYFIAKIFKAIDAFSKKFNLEYEVMMDEEIWNYKIDI